MDLEHLAFFIRIFERGGVAAAGRDFGFSPATASTRLAALEDYYQVKLIQRTTRSLSLTDEGALLLETARHLVAEAADLEQKIRHGRDNISGHIRLSATHDFGRHRLMPVLDKFMTLYPDITIELILEDYHIDLVASGVDLALRFGDLKDSSLIVRKIGENHRVVVASPSYLKARGRPKHPDDLRDHNCLIIKFASRLDNLWRFKLSGRYKNYRVKGNRITNNGDMIRRWCLDGQGIALKSIWDVSDDLQSGRLVEVLTKFQSGANSSLQAVFSGGGIPSRRVTAFVDFATAELAAPI